MPNRVNVRNACITCNNPTSSAEDVLSRAEASEACTFLVFQKEVGESGTPHYQGYAEFSRSVRFSHISRIFGSSCHVEARRGSQAQAIEYCQKGDSREDGPWQYGEPKSGGSGTRTDLVSFKDRVKSGAKLRDLIESHTSVVARYPRFYHTLRMQYCITPRDEFRVVLLFGPPRCGKTRRVYSIVPLGELYSSPVMGSGFWLDGYSGEPSVLIDDFGGGRSKISRTSLLRLLDRYPVKAPVKGGFTVWNPEVVYITTNLKPQQWYDWTDKTHWPALRDRIHEVWHFTSTDEPTVLKQFTLQWYQFMEEPQVFSIDLPYNNN